MSDDAEQVEGVTLAIVSGEAITELPTDLYIPPEALEVFLETFAGPLDLLLYLIRRQNLDILDIKVAEITKQYMSYIDLMQAFQLELAGEYLVMAAMLAEIKSRMLLPRPESTEEEEGDPRAELIRRLQEYEQFKTGGQNLSEVPRLERDIQLGQASLPKLIRQHAEPEVDLKELLVSLARVLHRADMFQRHSVQMEPLSVRERMAVMLQRINDRDGFIAFFELFEPEQGRMGIIVSFLALMELMREALIDIVQNEEFGVIHIRVAAEASSG